MKDPLLSSVVNDSQRVYGPAPDQEVYGRGTLRVFSGSSIVKIQKKVSTSLSEIKKFPTCRSSFMTVKR